MRSTRLCSRTLILGRCKNWSNWRSVGVRTFATVTNRVPWPHVRRRALYKEIADFLDPPKPVAGDKNPIMWLTGAQGSGSFTAASAVLSDFKKTGDVAIASFDCSTSRVSRKLIQNFLQSLRRQLSEILSSFQDRQATITALGSAVLQRYPEKAPQALRSITKALAERNAVSGLRPLSPDVSGFQEALATHQDDCTALFLQLSELLTPASRSIAPASTRSGVSAGAVASIEVALDVTSAMAKQTQGSESLMLDVQYLLAACECVKQVSDSSFTLVLLRADVLTQQSSLQPDGFELLKTIEACADNGGFRALVQTQDSLTVLRATDAGASVVTVDEWPEEMARALFFGRYVNTEEAWKGVWSSVGGHAAHLKKLATELLEAQQKYEKEQKRKKEQEKMEQQLLSSEESSETQRKLEEVKSLEQEAKRADLALEVDAAEGLLRDVSAALSKEIDALDMCMAKVLNHPLIQDLRGNLVGKPGAFWACLGGMIKELCTRPDLHVADFAALNDPIVLAFLDVGLLVPKWGPDRLVFANTLTRWWLPAWADAQSEKLPVREQMTYQSELSQGNAAAKKLIDSL